jgi:DNA-nicking Smr family endonuclease
MGRKAEPRHGLGDNERALWQAATRDAVPLKGRRAPGPEPTPATPVDVRAPPPPPAGIVARRAADTGVPSVELPALGPDRAPGLDKRSWERLKAGQWPIETRIDLHGMTRDEAHRALTRFVLAAQADGRRCTLVITGRGQRAEGGAGVLKAEAPRWLNLPPVREHVLAFCPARPKHGGAGALYVLLKRQR